MLKRLPKQLPGIEEMLLQLGRPPIKAVAKALDVSPATVRRWIKTDRTPRAAHLALYWLTHAGRADIELDMHNEIIVTWGLARAYEREIKQLHQTISHLICIGGYGAANDPLAHASERGPRRHLTNHQIRAEGPPHSRRAAKQDRMS